MSTATAEKKVNYGDASTLPKNWIVGLGKKWRHVSWKGEYDAEQKEPGVVTLTPRFSDYPLEFDLGYGSRGIYEVKATPHTVHSMEELKAVDVAEKEKMNEDVLKSRATVKAQYEAAQKSAAEAAAKPKAKAKKGKK